MEEKREKSIFQIEEDGKRRERERDVSNRRRKRRR